MAITVARDCAGGCVSTQEGSSDRRRGTKRDCYASWRARRFWYQV